MTGQNDQPHLPDTPDAATSAKSDRIDEAGDYPTRYGQYRAQTLLGLGELGPAYRARDSLGGPDVVVKIIRLGRAPEEARDRAVAAGLEALAAVSLNHHAIAAPLAAGFEHQAPYLVYQFAKGVSLDVLLKSPLRAGETLAFLAQIAAALDFARYRGIAHGRLHPRDVIVDGSEARITGLGVAGALAVAGAVAPNRFPYMAPEALEAARPTAAADVYGLAMVATEALLGSDALEIPLYASQDRPRLIEHGFDPDRWLMVMERARDPDPSARFATCLAFLEALEATQPTRSIHAPAAAETETLLPETPEAAAGLQTPASVSEEVPMTADPFKGEDSRDDLPIRRQPDRHEEAQSRLDFDWTSGVNHRDEVEEGETESGPARHAFDEYDALARDEPAAHESPTDAQHPPLSTSEPPLERVPYSREEQQRPAPFSTYEDERPSTARRIVAAALLLLVGGAGGYWLGRRTASAPPAPAATSAPAASAALRPSVPAPPGTDTAPGSATPRGPTQAAPRAAQPPRAAAPRAAVTAPQPQPRGASSTRPAVAATRPGASATAGAASARTATGPARLRIISAPAGAQVLVNGAPRGETPIVLRGLEAGTYDIRVQKAGFDPQRRRVRLTRRHAAATARFQLAKSAKPKAAPVAQTARTETGAAGEKASAAGPTGAVAIDSHPSGSAVSMDGRPAGKTPLVIEQLAPGPHTIQVDREGYARWTGLATVVAGKTTRVTASLEAVKREN